MLYYFKMWVEYTKKAILQWNEYRVDFMFISFASVLSLAIGLANILIIFNKVDNILGWTKFEVIWLLGYFFIVQCIFNTFCVNLFDIGYWVFRGELDVLKSRPLSVVFQLLFSERYNTEFPIDQLVMGVVLLVWSDRNLAITWDVLTIGYFIVSIIISAIIYSCIVFIVSSLSLWTIKNNYIIEFLFELEEINQYPLPVYGQVIASFLTYIIPLGFVSFYPNQLLLGHSEYFSYIKLTPVVVIVLVTLSVTIWKFGIANYQSPNS